MARYIDAELLMQKLSRMIDYCEKNKDKKINALNVLFQVGDAIMDCPTADVVHKSEVEKLQGEILALKQKRLNLFERLGLMENARIKAVIEFADRLKPKVDCEYGNKFYRDKCFAEIDNLVKEMTGGK